MTYEACNLRLFGPGSVASSGCATSTPACPCYRLGNPRRLRGGADGSGKRRVAGRLEAPDLDPRALADRRARPPSCRARQYGPAIPTDGEDRPGQGLRSQSRRRRYPGPKLGRLPGRVAAHAGWFLIAAGVAIALHAGVRNTRRNEATSLALIAIVAVFVAISTVLEASSEREPGGERAGIAGRERGGRRESGAGAGRLRTREAIIINLPTRIFDVTFKPFVQLGNSSQRAGCDRGADHARPAVAARGGAVRRRGEIFARAGPTDLAFFLLIAYLPQHRQRRHRLSLPDPPRGGRGVHRRRPVAVAHRTSRSTAADGGAGARSRGAPRARLQPRNPGPHPALPPPRRERAPRPPDRELIKSSAERCCSRSACCSPRCSRSPASQSSQTWAARSRALEDFGGHPGLRGPARPAADGEIAIAVSLLFPPRRAGERLAPSRSSGSSSLADS